MDAQTKTRTFLTFKQLQEEHTPWREHNFPEETAYQAILGAVEEVGELAHHYLKMEQEIRGTKVDHEDGMKDSMADCIIFLAGLCGIMGWDMQQIMEYTWDRVKQRDWQRDSMRGGEGTDGT